MQRQKNIRLLISLAVLLISIGAVWFFGSQERSVVDKSLFQIPEQELVDRVVLESPKGKTELRYDGTRWKVDNRWEADQQLIKIFFATTLKTEAKRPVATSLREKIGADIKSRGIKVSFFKAGALAKEYWVAGNEQHTETYFAYAEESPYLVTIPGYRAYVASVFELTSGEWRDKRVFNFNGQNFRSLEATFPKNVRENFKITFTGKSFEVEGVTALDTAQLNSYLDAVSFVQADKILETDQAKADSLKQVTPLIQIVVKDIGGNEYPLTVYPFGKEEMALGNAFGGEIVRFNLSSLAPVVVGRSRFQRQANQ